MKRQSDLPTLEAGLDWLRGHLDELADVPVRLHDHAVGDRDALGSPRFSGAFWHRLVGSAFATHEVKTQVSCYHPLLFAKNDGRVVVSTDCPECFGASIKEARRDEYDRPLSAAMVALSKVPAPSLGTPAPIHYILALLTTGVSDRPAPAIASDAAYRLGIPAISSGPMPSGAPKWTDLSDAQRSAVMAGEGAAA